MKIKEVLFGKRIRNKGYFMRLCVTFCFHWFGVTTVALVWSILGLYSPWYFNLNVPAFSSLSVAMAQLDLMRILLNNPVLLLLGATLPIALLTGVLCFEVPYSKLHWEFDGWYVYRFGGSIVFLPPAQIIRQTNTRILQTPLPEYLCGKPGNWLDTLITQKWFKDAIAELSFPENRIDQLYKFAAESQHWI